MKPTVSVVVIGRNEGERLARCLESVRKMDFPNEAVELIYVDSRSEDDSVVRARGFGCEVIELRKGPTTAARGRNAGWRAASADYILFLDGDTILQPGFVKAALAEIVRDDVAIVWGHRRELQPEASLFNRALDLDWIYPPGLSDFCGGDALVKRSVLERVEGFDESLIAGEEPEMCRRVRDKGFRIMHLDEPMTLHDLAMTKWSQYWKRAVRAGHAYAEVASRFRVTSDPLWVDEVRANRVRALALLGLLVSSLAACGHWGDPRSALLLAALLGVLVLRSAMRAGWKSRDPATLLLYGLHSHFQQIPVFWGQIEYHLRRVRRHQPMLIEYKQ